jgi:hypothetical protein
VKGLIALKIGNLFSMIGAVHKEFDGHALFAFNNWYVWWINNQCEPRYARPGERDDLPDFKHFVRNRTFFLRRNYRKKWFLTGYVWHSSWSLLVLKRLHG